MGSRNHSKSVKWIFRMWWINLRETIYISMMMVTRTIFSHLATNNSRKMIIVLTNPHYIFGTSRKSQVIFPITTTHTLKLNHFWTDPNHVAGDPNISPWYPWIAWYSHCHVTSPSRGPEVVEGTIYRKLRSSEWKTTLFIDVPLNQSIYPYDLWCCYIW